MDVRRSEPGRARGFAVPLTVGVAVWMVVTTLLPVVQVETGFYPPYVLAALWAFTRPLALAAAGVLVVLGVFRLLRALERHLGAGRPAPTARVDVERPADR
ncbi:hypothetical protein [Pseudokineococcus lusitanus]|uniref:Uncharacterized protein n=1 Tax=Pseudokineococcus lusitanus TaxID=763993 RepID=A0A3N1HR01_9ACTN|nr:hypothetical protein [Pseudokineococcus lusitanus]ROP44948.1 hypothetical protein EDC03_1078 [Pseudokineococcus lusitanus]